MVVTDVLPLAETKPAILTDRDGFLAYITKVKTIHNGHSYMCERVEHTSRSGMTTDHTPIDVVASIRLNGVLLLTVLTHAEEGEQLRLCPQKT